MLSVMDELGNPFLEDSKDLIALDTKDIVPGRVVESVKMHTKLVLANITATWRTD